MKQSAILIPLFVCILAISPGCNSTNSSIGNAEVENPALGVENEAETNEEIPSEVEVDNSVTEGVSVIEELEVEKVEELEVEEVDLDLVAFIGMIQYVELEGGFFGIVAEDGRKFFPQYLDSSFKKDGLSVRVSGKLDKEVFGIQMWGTPFTVSVIEEI